jgi:uncharacterized protein (TIGR04255 family)
MTASVPEAPVPRPPYVNAPIIEAVIDIHVELPSGEAVADSLRAFADSIASQFPRREQLHQVEFLVQGQPGGASSHSSNSQQVGWRLFNASNDRIMLLKHNSFTYSHLWPYTKWEIFSAECAPLWQRFVDACKPTKVTRIAVRNINRLKLPPGNIELSDYLTFGPEVPNAFGPISRVLVQVQTPLPSISEQSASVVTLATEASAKPEYQPMVLDIDVYEPGAWGAEELTIWQQLGKLRDKKNELFEACITDATRRLFA